MIDVLEAIMGIVLLVTVFIILGVVARIYLTIYKLNHPTPYEPPPAPQTNTVVWLTTEYFDYNYSLYGEVSPTYGHIYTNGFVGYQAISLNNGFNIQYGVDGNTNPWIVVNGDNIPQNEIGYVTVNNSTTNDYTFTLTLPGYGNLASSFDNTDDVDESSIVVTNDATTTDDVGDAFSFTNSTPYPLTTNVVIIQRSTNLITWVSIYTNAIMPGGVYNYSDTNIFWPNTTTYYNTNGSSGGGGIMPTGSDGSSTNGIISVVGQAYYRIEYPSNQADYISLFSD